MSLRFRGVASAVAAAAALAAMGSAQAGSVQMLVTDKDGKPVPDVVVLVDTGNKAVPKALVAPVVIGQEDSRFVPFLTVVPLGSTLRFVNRDTYDHHVRSTPSGPLGNTPPAVNFTLRLNAAAVTSAATASAATAAAKPAAGTFADIKLDAAGAIGLGCHIHASMRGQVYVSGTPWFGKTDANGAISIDDVPDGPADVVLWHADQLQDQPAVHVTVGNVPVKAIAALNFVPRKRRGG